MFRSGRTGVALLIMRFCLLGTLALHLYRFGPIFSAFWSTPIVLLITVGLAVGVTTSIACLAFCLAEIGFMLSASNFDQMILTFSLPVAIALALLGPGAYSLDARIFGRRVIVLPPEDHT